MRKIRFYLLGLVLGGCSLAARAQQPDEFVARRLADDRHYYASDRLAASLVAKYHLRESGTAARIDEWVRTYPTAAVADRLRLLRANLLVEEGRYDEALEVYKRVDASLLTHDEHTETLLSESVARIQRGDFDRAATLLKSIEDEESHAVDVLYYEGYVLYAKGQFAEALPYFTAMTESFDYRRKAPVYAADCLVQTGNHQQALDAIRQYRQQWGQTDLALDARRIEGEALYGTKSFYDAIIALKQYVDESEQPQRTALYKLGMSYLQTRAYGSAATNLSRSALMAPQTGDALSQNAWLHAGHAYLHLKNMQQARMAFERAAETDFSQPIQEEALYNYALTLHEGATMGFGESVRAFETFLNRYPQSQYKPLVEKHLTEVYFTTKNYPAALASINKIQSPSQEILSAKQTVLYNLGVQKFIDGDLESAKSFMQQSLDTGRQAQATGKAESAEAYYWKGEAEYRLGEYGQALSDLTQYRQQTQANGKNLAQAQYTLGYTLFKQKHYDQALTHFQQFANHGEADSRTRADSFNRLGDCYFANRQYNEAYDSYQQALDTHRSQGDYALLQQAFICGLRGDYNKKVELLAQLDNQYEDSEYAVDALFEQGRAYTQSGERDKALNAFNALTLKYPLSNQARKAGNEIGMILNEQGKTEAAITAYKQVIANYPNSPEAQTALSNLKDIFTEQGRVNEYAALATQAGRQLSAAEMDDMVLGAALRAVSNGNYSQAYIHYQQLEAQTTSADMRAAAQAGQLRSAAAAQDYATTIDVATRLLNDNARIAPDLVAEAHLLRAQSHKALGQPAEAVADWQAAMQDMRTVHGAQATVELSQYAYDTEQYNSAEEVLTHFIDQGTTHTYWLARAFVLLADVYAKTNREIEAKQYLISLRSNYTESEEINRMIEERLARL